MLILTGLAAFFLFQAVPGSAAPHQAFPLPQGGAALVIVLLLQALKGWDRFPWLQANAGTIGRIAAILAAAMGGVGIHAAFDQQAGALTIHGLNAATFKDVGSDAAQILVWSEALFKNLFQRR